MTSNSSREIACAEVTFLFKLGDYTEVTIPDTDHVCVVMRPGRPMEIKEPPPASYTVHADESEKVYPIAFAVVPRNGLETWQRHGDDMIRQAMEQTLQKLYDGRKPEGTIH